MQEYTQNGRTYRLAGNLSDFQRDLYIHLTDWKRARFGEECGYHLHQGRKIPYDVILPAVRPGRSSWSTGTSTPTAKPSSGKRGWSACTGTGWSRCERIACCQRRGESGRMIAA